MAFTVDDDDDDVDVVEKFEVVRGMRGERGKKVAGGMDVKKFGAPEKATTMTATQQTRKSFSPESTTSSNDTRHESMRVSSG